MLQWAIMNTLKAKETVVYPPSFIPDTGHFYLLFTCYRLVIFADHFTKPSFYHELINVFIVLKPNRPKLLSVYLSQLSINSFLSNLLYVIKTKIFVSSLQLTRDGKGSTLWIKGFLIQSQKLLLLGQKVHSLLRFQSIRYLTHYYYLYCNLFSRNRGSSSSKT